jgi:hypothetical protein
MSESFSRSFHNTLTISGNTQTNGKINDELKIGTDLERSCRDLIDKSYKHSIKRTEENLGKYLSSSRYPGGDSDELRCESIMCWGYNKLRSSSYFSKNGDIKTENNVL